MIDEQVAEDGHLAHEQFQTQYLTLIGWVQDALDKHREEEEARERDSLKVSKVRHLGEKGTAAYQHIETVLGELKTRLEGEPIDNVELLDVKSALLDEVKAQINSATALVDSMFTTDPDQSVITLEAQGTRRTAAKVKVHTCEELVAKMQSAINTRNAAAMEAAAAAAAAAEVVEVPAARMKITPKFERQSLPDFTSGKLREFPMFKKDWLELVSDRYDPAHELRLIRKSVPKSVQHVVTRLTSMPDMWEFMDEEFGGHSELTSERIDHLHAFQYSEGAASESQKFMELYDWWTEVYHDLESVGE